jgi:Ca2+-binding RTX toxin-like protein
VPPLTRIAPDFLEPLERRRLFTVTVTEGYPGFYEVDGDASAEFIDISVSQVNSTFTVDNVTYDEVAYLQVHGNGGGDFINVSSTDGTGSFAAVISGGEGDDYIFLNFDGGIWGDDGDDVIDLSESYYGVANGEDGNDMIYVSGGCTSADVDGGEGNDLVDATSATVPLVLHGGAGNDTLYGTQYADQLYGETGADQLYGGDGNDMLYARDDGFDTLDGGTGYDIAYVDTTEGSIIQVEELN